MKRIEINIPESLSEITLMQYQAFIAASETYKGNPVLVDQLMIQYLCGIPLEDVTRLPYSESEFIINQLSSLFKTETHAFKERFKLDGLEYGFITDLENISLGEYLDLDATIVDVDQWHNAMAVMYRPIVNKPFWKKKPKYYEILPHESNPIWQEAMKYAPLDVVLGALFFFQNLERDLLKSTLNSSLAEAEKLIIQVQRSSDKNGDGTLQSGNLLKETLQDLKKLRSLVSTNA
jgi:hypothetical protein